MVSATVIPIHRRLKALYAVCLIAFRTCVSRARIIVLLALAAFCQMSWLPNKLMEIRTEVRTNIIHLFIKYKNNNILCQAKQEIISAHCRVYKIYILKAGKTIVKEESTSDCLKPLQNVCHFTVIFYKQVPQTPEQIKKYRKSYKQ